MTPFVGAFFPTSALSAPSARYQGGYEARPFR